MTDFPHQPVLRPAPADDGACAHLPGQRLPALTLPGTDGAVHDLSALNGSGAGPERTVLYLYPMTARPGVALPDDWDVIPGARGCTPQSCAFRDHHAELRDRGATVLGLSAQDTAYQAEAAARLHLPFALLADPDLQLARALKLPTFQAGGRTLYRRVTLIVRGNVIEQVWHPVFPPEQNAAEVLAWLRAHPTAPAGSHR